MVQKIEVLINAENELSISQVHSMVSEWQDTRTLDEQTGIITSYTNYGAVDHAQFYSVSEDRGSLRGMVDMKEAQHRFEEAEARVEKDAWAHINAVKLALREKVPEEYWQPVAERARELFEQ